MSIRNFFRRQLERRKHRRQSIIETAWMRIEDEPYPFVCVIWDISEGGARIAVANPQVVSDQITLLLDRDATYGTRCRVVWRTDEQVGLEFLENAQAIFGRIKQSAMPVG
jgi:hypothetical protein